MLPYATTTKMDKLTVIGFLGDIWNILQEELNFTWVTKYPNKTKIKTFIFRSTIQSIDYDDGLDMINNKEADILLAAAVANSMRKNVEFSQPYFYNWWQKQTQII